jgi:hypothetical protein
VETETKENSLFNVSENSKLDIKKKKLTKHLPTTKLKHPSSIIFDSNELRMVGT